jgi:hypothetical protein
MAVYNGGAGRTASMVPQVGRNNILQPSGLSVNLSIASSSVSSQWKEACITPIPKVSCPQQPSDFRPISITPILSRLMERTVVRSVLYPTFLKSPHNLSFSDQYAFHPTGSTTAAIVSYLLSPTCNSPIHMSSSFRWTSQKRSTPSAMPHY